MNVTSATQTASTSKTSGLNANDMQDRFLKLLVAQMSNQDPMNPMDNAQTTSQMAQISTVTGIEKMNSNMGSFGELLSANRLMQATNMIGHTVVAEGDQLALKNGKAYGAFELAVSAEQVDVEILNAAGQVIATETLRNQGAGMVQFDWDGATSDGKSAPDNTYQFRVTAISGGQKQDATELITGKVGSVAVKNGTATLQLDGLGSLAVDAVRLVM